MNTKFQDAHVFPASHYTVRHSSHRAFAMVTQYLENQVRTSFKAVSNHFTDNIIGRFSASTLAYYPYHLLTFVSRSS